MDLWRVGKHAASRSAVDEIFGRSRWHGVSRVVTTIAGHTFHNGRCDCGAHWLVVRTADDTCVGQTGWAHTGQLTAYELSGIRAEVEREEQAMMEALHGVASGGPGTSTAA